MPRISTDNYDTVASWNGSQDLFIVEQPDGTKVATPAMIKQYVLGNSIDDVYSVMGQNGAKNLIPYPYNETTQVDHGVTFTVNNDGTVIANGTANGTAQLYLVLGNVSLSAAGNLVINTNKPLFLSGCPSGGGNTTFRIQYGLTDGTTYWAKTASDIGSGVEITPVDGLNSYCFDVIKIMVFAGYTALNLTFKPMLRLATDTDDTYQPYAKTNKELTEAIGDLSQTGLTGDSVAEQLVTAREQIANLIAYQECSLTNSASIAANSYKQFNIDITKSGYTPIGVMGFSGSGTGKLAIMEFYVASATSAVVYLNNLTSAAITPTQLKLKILYIKS